MILSCAEMKAAEDALFATGVEAEPLMEKAGRGCAEAILTSTLGWSHARLYVGKGHNGGDALVVGRILREQGWKVECHLVAERSELADLTAKKLQEFEAVETHSRNKGNAHIPYEVLVDGLLGIGAKGPLRGKYRELADDLNRRRKGEAGQSFAIDIPTGVDGDTGEVHEGAVIADATLTIAYAKRGLLEDPALDHVGQIHLIQVPEIVALEGDAERSLVTASSLAPHFPIPAFSQHKGEAGRVGIVAGSRGMTGAAVLCSLGALQAGAGLVTLFVPEDIYPIVATLAPIEVMVRPLSSFDEVLEFHLDTVAIGPGLGFGREDAVLDYLQRETRPMVIDADGLNILAKHPDVLRKVCSAEAPRLLTPHPGELQRLLPKVGGLNTRLEQAQAFAETYPCTLLYKGARSIVLSPGESIAYNTTGTPGMATGGIGDVLTGIAAALMGHGHSPYIAASAGSWLIGRAGERAIGQSLLTPESLTARKIVDSLPVAFCSLRERNS